MLRRLALAACAAVVAVSCAQPRPPAVAPGPPKYPEFVFPEVPADLARAFPQAVRDHRQSWQVLQSGDLRAAERGFLALSRKLPAFYPTMAGLGYADLASGEPRRAVERFDQALRLAESYAPALVGRGQALLAQRRDDEALVSFEAALAADPSLVDLRDRIAVLRLRGLERLIADAQAAAQEGRLEAARSAYEQALRAAPESAFVYRELARVERRAGSLDAALSHARRAIELDAGDADALVALGEIFEARQAWDPAVDAYERARALGAGDLDDRIADLRERAALARLPDAYRDIPSSPRLTRGDLAALVGVRLAPLLRASRGLDTVLITDSRTHWAHPWIVAVARAGIMSPYENHTFQPRNVVRRADLAVVASRLLMVVASRDPNARAWTTARGTFTDLGPGHLAYQAVSSAVASGVMQVAAGQAFQPSRVVTGADAVDTIGRLERLAAGAGFATSR